MNLSSIIAAARAYEVDPSIVYVLSALLSFGGAALIVLTLAK